MHLTHCHVCLCLRSGDSEVNKRGDRIALWSCHGVQCPEPGALGMPRERPLLGCNVWTPPKTLLNQAIAVIKIQTDLSQSQRQKGPAGLGSTDCVSWQGSSLLGKGRSPKGSRSHSWVGGASSARGWGEARFPSDPPRSTWPSQWASLTLEAQEFNPALYGCNDVKSLSQAWPCLGISNQCATWE